MRIYSLHSCFKIFLIQFARRQVKAVIVAGNGNGAGAEVGVQDFVAGLCVVVQQPFVQGYRLLGGVDAVFKILFSKTIPSVFYFSNGSFK